MAQVMDNEKHKTSLLCKRKKSDDKPKVFMDHKYCGSKWCFQIYNFFAMLKCKYREDRLS